MTDERTQSGFGSNAEREAREFYCCGDREALVRWASMTEDELAYYTREHGRLLSVQVARFRAEHPTITSVWLDMGWVDAFYRALAMPFVTIWKAARRGR